MGRLQEGLADMEEARKDKATDEHNVIDDAIQDRGEGYTVFSIVSPYFSLLWLGSSADINTAGRRPLPTIRKETQELSAKRLHGESGE